MYVFFRFLRWLRSIKREEKIALLCITAVFAASSYLICLLFVSVPADKWLWDRAFTIFLLSLLAVSIPGAFAVWLGNVLPSILFLKTLKKGVPASPLLAQLGFHSAESVLHFARLFKLSVFTVPQELRTNTSADVDCRLQPLFLAPGYPPGLRDKYYNKNLLWFDDEEIKPVLEKIAKGAVILTPEILHSIDNNEKDRIIEGKDQTIEEMDQAIKSLQSEAEAMQRKLSKKNLGDGPYRASAWSRLFSIIEMYAALVVMGRLLVRWHQTEERERKEYEIKGINEEFEAILSLNDTLKALLQKINPDAKLDKFQKETSRLLRIAMPAGTVTWGGQPKPSMESIFKEIMTKREAKELNITKDSDSK